MNRCHLRDELRFFIDPPEVRAIACKAAPTGSQWSVRAKRFSRRFMVCQPRISAHMYDTWPFGLTKACRSHKSVAV